MTILEDFDRLSNTIVVGGRSRRSTAAERLDVIDPATGGKLGEIVETTQQEIDEAVAAGHAAQ